MQAMKKVIYGFGISGKWAADQFDDVVAFVDTDIKKHGDCYRGVTVYGPAFLRSIDDKTTEVIVSVVDIMDVVPLLDKCGISNWKPLSHFIDFDLPLVNSTEESDSFLAYSLKTVKSCQESYLDNDALFIRSVDLVITEKCTLKCRDCANLMQFFESPKNIDADSAINGIKALAQRCNMINEVRVIGGEPFVNKDIYKIISELNTIENINSIVIYTNGMVPLKKEHVTLLQGEKIHFSVTDYGEIGKNTSETTAFLEANEISHRVHPPEHWTDSGRIEKFNRSDAELTELFSNCCGKNLFTLVEDRFYRCPFAANADSLGAVPRNDANSVSVFNTQSDLKKYTQDIPFLPACNFCPGRSFDAPEIIPAVQVKSAIPYERFSCEHGELNEP